MRKDEMSLVSTQGLFPTQSSYCKVYSTLACCE